MLSRRTFLRAAGNCIGAAAGCGYYSWRVELHWLEIVRRTLPVRGLPPSLAGRTLVQISDVHVGPEAGEPGTGRCGGEEMHSEEVERVLADWIAQATSPPGQLAPGTDPSQWVASQFLRWWREQTADELASAEAAVTAVVQELERLGGWSNPELGETLHEMIHAREALAGLRSILGFGKGAV